MDAKPAAGFAGSAGSFRAAELLRSSSRGERGGRPPRKTLQTLQCGLGEVDVTSGVVTSDVEIATVSGLTWCPRDGRCGCSRPARLRRAAAPPARPAALPASSPWDGLPLRRQPPPCRRHRQHLQPPRRGGAEGVGAAAGRAGAPRAARCRPPQTPSNCHKPQHEDARQEPGLDVQDVQLRSLALAAPPGPGRRRHLLRRDRDRTLWAFAGEVSGEETCRQAHKLSNQRHPAEVECAQRQPRPEQGRRRRAADRCRGRSIKAIVCGLA